MLSSDVSVGTGNRRLEFAMGTFNDAVRGAVDSFEESVMWYITDGVLDEFLRGEEDPEGFDIDDILDALEPHAYRSDIISEVADGSVPIYNGDRADCLSEDPGIACAIEEHGMDPTGDLWTDLGLAIYLRIEEEINDAISDGMDSVVLSAIERRDAILRDLMWSARNPFARQSIVPAMGCGDIGLVLTECDECGSECIAMRIEDDGGRSGPFGFCSMECANVEGFEVFREEVGNDS